MGAIVGGVQYWTPREIAEKGMITNYKGKADYHFVLRLIKAGRLQYVVLNPESKVEYKLVPQSEVDVYIESMRLK